MTITTQRAQIERVIIHYTSKNVEAQFKTPDGYFLCRAWIRPNGDYGIGLREGSMDIVTVSTVGLAARMAIDWVTDELAKRLGAK